MSVGRHLITGALMVAVTTLLFGIVYPLVVTGLAQVLFPREANGQLIERMASVVGSRLIGQPFHLARVFLAAAIGGRRWL